MSQTAVVSRDEAETPHRRDGALRARIARRLVRYQLRRPLALSPRRPMVSFSFDDPPLSATVAGAAILEAAGLRGVFYVASSLLGGSAHFGPYADWKDIERLAARGHEIGCHTYGHTDFAGHVADEVEDEIQRNAAAFAHHGLSTARTFAYPYGEVTRVAKTRLGSRFGLLRAIHAGVLTAGVDLNQAPAVAIEGPEAKAIGAKWLDVALAKSGWVIFYCHDVAEAPTEWGCTPEALIAITERVRKSAAEVVTISEGLRRLGVIDG